MHINSKYLTKEFDSLAKDLIKDINPYKEFTYPENMDQIKQYLKHLDVNVCYKINEI